MKKRIIDLADEKPLLDVAAYARAGRMPTPAQRFHIALTVHRSPEVMVKVSGGARTLGGVERHIAYIGREGDLGLETDTGAHIDGKAFQHLLVDDWNLEVDALENLRTHSSRFKKPPKLVHNIIFSMPPGTSPGAVLKAVQRLALTEWELQHRYAMALHIDNAHPHVHVVLKAVSERGGLGSIFGKQLSVPGAPNLQRTSVNSVSMPMRLSGPLGARLSFPSWMESSAQVSEASQRICPDAEMSLNASYQLARSRVMMHARVWNRLGDE